MPLIKSNSKQAFSKNVSEMIKAGHPQDQSLAAAYSIKRKYAEGGNVAHDKMMSDLMKKRKEAKEGFNTEPDLREDSSSLSNSTLFDDLAGSEQGRPDAEESMYAEGGIAYESNLKENEGEDPELIHSEEAYDTGGPVLPDAQSAQDSMRKAFKFAKGGEAPKIPQARSYVQYGDLMHDKDGNDVPHHDSLPQSTGKEDAFYKPKPIGNNGRPSIDLNMYAPGGKVKMAYGQGRSEEDQTDLAQTHDEDSSIAMAQGGTVEEAKHLAPNDTDTAEETNESNYSEPPQDNGLDKDPKTEAYLAEGGVAYSNKSEFETDDAPLEHNEERYSEPEGDYGPDDDTEDQAYYADGGPVQDDMHNPKSGESESPKARRKRLMMESLNS